MADDTDRREIGYYSTPAFVAEFIARRIFELRPTTRFVFDPCIGRGEFTAPFKARGSHVTGYDVVDMNPQACDNFVNADFVKVVMESDVGSLFHRKPNDRIDAIIANPPYNCHEVEYIRSQKSQLSARFGKAAALNMYALFIHAILDFAPEDCLIGLVTHDSFLTASGHQDLRRAILDRCTIHNIHLCPTNLFIDQGADVRTCILILEKNRQETVPVKVSNRPSSVEEFRDILDREIFQECQIEQLLLSDSRDNLELTIGVPHEIRAIFEERRLSDLAPCVTGISTGEDKKYLKSIKSGDFAIPFYKNPASRSFYAAPDGYLCTNYQDVEKEVPNFLIRNKDLIFRGGISCSSMGVKFGATIRPKDSACGVNPNIIVEDDMKWWLLSFLNSRLCLYITRGVIIRTNMITAGYAGRIPIPSFDQAVLEELKALGLAGFAAAQAERSIKEIKLAIDLTIERFLDLTEETKALLQKFERDPSRLS